MTAAIVTHRERTPLNDRAAASWAYSGQAEKRGTATPGQLWERASTEDKSERNARGWLLAYYVTSRDGYATRKAFDTRDEAQAWLDANESPTAQRFFGYGITCGLRFTKSGKCIKFEEVAA